MQQDFDKLQIDHSPDWQDDQALDNGPFTEGGAFFASQQVEPPPAKRATYRIDDNFHIELYTREQRPLILDYLDIVSDPENATNRVLKIMTPKHTDAVYLRPSRALPERYKLSYRIGYMDYGDSTELNGYDSGDETGEPWTTRSAVKHNGFYWLALLDTEPRPHNNIWMHHHRKFVIDSWNRDPHKYSFNVIALDGLSQTHAQFGKQFNLFVDGEFKQQQDGASGYYLPGQWYEVTFIRTPDSYEFRISGQFRDTPQTAIEGKIDTRRHCVFHFNQTAEELPKHCIDNTGLEINGKTIPNWPADSGYSDYFIIGEPHINFYEGQLLIDDITLTEL